MDERTRSKIPNSLDANDDTALLVSVIVPALNEEANIGSVVTDLFQLLRKELPPQKFEILVADNNSSDQTKLCALQAGAQVIFVKEPGYGAACWQACRLAQGSILLFVDGDGSVCIEDALPLLRLTMQGIDLAIGVRVHPEAGSMSTAQRFGNWLACALMRRLWGIPASDLGPLRAVRRRSFLAMTMQDRGFGWTVEMQVKAALLNQRVVEVPVRWRNRLGGCSKIGGTVRGVFAAARGILGMLFKLRRQYPFHADAGLYAKVRCSPGCSPAPSTIDTSTTRCH